MIWILIIFTIILSFILITILIVKRLNSKFKTEEKKYRANYPSRYICFDGEKVRSLSECIIDNYFYTNGIQHHYEDIILKTSEKQYKYDWYLPEIDVYVEFFGFSGKTYSQKTEDKIEFYRKHNLKMIALNPSDLDNIEEKIPMKFGVFWNKMIHSYHCPNCGSKFDNRVKFL